MLRKLISVFACICLAVSYVAAGLGICAGIPHVTRILAENNSNYALSPYSQDTLVELACETRDFTVLDYGRLSEGSDKAALAFSEAISSITGTPYDPSDIRRFLDEDAIEHLDDVHNVISFAFWPLIVIAALAILSLAHVFVRYGRRAGADILIASGIIMLIFMAAIAIWAAVGFDAFFDVFHSFFFAQGTWTFPYDSLLICMYPIGFWIGMAAIWAVSSAVLGLIAMIVGMMLRFRRSAEPKADTGA